MKDASAEPPTPPSDGPAKPKRDLSRRSFVTRAGLAVGALGVTGGVGLNDLLAAASRSGEPDPKVPKKIPHLSFLVERETDLVLLEFLFYEFKLVKTSSPRAIVPTSAANLIIVQFPPQAIAEATYASDLAGTVLPVDPAPIVSRLAGRSRLSFTVPKSTRIPLHTMTPADLLNWDGWALNVTPGAQYAAAKPAAAPSVPTAAQTLVEAPYGMYLSPVVDVGSKRTSTSFNTGFRNATKPLSVNEVTACWSTTLTATAEEVGATVSPQVAAVWSRDYDGGNATPQTEIQY
jgi:hypothetical protein